MVPAQADRLALTWGARSPLTTPTYPLAPRQPSIPLTQTAPPPEDGISHPAQLHRQPGWWIGTLVSLKLS